MLNAGPRRTLLPWFIRCDPHSDSLEISAGGTYSEVIAAHQDLTMTAKTVSGYPFRYGRTPYASPAASTLEPVNPIGQALAGQLRWTSPAVQRTLRWMESASVEGLAGFVREQRQRSMPAYRRAYEKTAALKEQLFGQRSYYHHLRTGAPRPPPDEDPHAASDEDAED